MNNAGKSMLLTRLAFRYLPDCCFTPCLGGNGPKLDQVSRGGLPFNFQRA